MPNAKQSAAMERLIAHSERNAEALSKYVYLTYAPQIRDNSIDHNGLYDVLFQAVLANAGLLAKPMARALKAFYPDAFVKFAEPDLDRVGKHLNVVVAESMKNPVGLTAINSVAKDYVMTQTRRSIAKQAGPSSHRLVRIADGGACVYCKKKEGTPAPNGDIDSHTGCNCYVGVK